MTRVRNYVATIFLLLLIYSLFTVANEGPNFFPGFFADLFAVGWNGQIAFDLVCFTSLAGLWVAWRHDFSSGGIVLGVIVLVGAMLAFAPYLLWAMRKVDGDVGRLLAGKATV